MVLTNCLRVFLLFPNQKVCEETLAEHTKRLAELRQLVSDIAADVGLDADALLGGEVDALGRRLVDVKDSLTILANVAENQAAQRDQTKNQINGTKTTLNSIQKVSSIIKPLEIS